MPIEDVNKRHAWSPQDFEKHKAKAAKAPTKTEEISRKVLPSTPHSSGSIKGFVRIVKDKFNKIISVLKAKFVAQKTLAYPSTTLNIAQELVRINKLLTQAGSDQALHFDAEYQQLMLRELTQASPPENVLNYLKTLKGSVVRTHDLEQMFAFKQLLSLIQTSPWGQSLPAKVKENLIVTLAQLEKGLNSQLRKEIEQLNVASTELHDPKSKLVRNGSGFKVEKRKGLIPQKTGRSQAARQTLDYLRKLVDLSIQQNDPQLIRKLNNLLQGIAHYTGWGKAISTHHSIFQEAHLRLDNAYKAAKATQPQMYETEVDLEEAWNELLKPEEAKPSVDLNREVGVLRGLLADGFINETQFADEINAVLPNRDALAQLDLENLDFIQTILASSPATTEEEALQLDENQLVSGWRALLEAGSFTKEHVVEQLKEYFGLFPEAKQKLTPENIAFLESMLAEQEIGPEAINAANDYVLGLQGLHEHQAANAEQIVSKIELYFDGKPELLALLNEDNKGFIQSLAIEQAEAPVLTAKLHVQGTALESAPEPYQPSAQELLDDLLNTIKLELPSTTEFVESLDEQLKQNQEIKERIFKKTPKTRPENEAVQLIDLEQFKAELIHEGLDQEVMEALNEVCEEARLNPIPGVQKALSAISHYFTTNQLPKEDAQDYVLTLFRKDQLDFISELNTLKDTYKLTDQTEAFLFELFS